MNPRVIDICAFLLTATGRARSFGREGWVPSGKQITRSPEGIPADGSRFPITNPLSVAFALKLNELGFGSLALCGISVQHTRFSVRRLRPLQLLGRL